MKLVRIKGRNNSGSRRGGFMWHLQAGRAGRSKPVHSLWTTCFLGEHHRQEGSKSQIKVKQVCPWGQSAPHHLISSLYNLPRLPTKPALPERLQLYIQLLLGYCKSFITRQKKNSSFSEIPSCFHTEVLQGSQQWTGIFRLSSLPSGRQPAGRGSTGTWLFPPQGRWGWWQWRVNAEVNPFINAHFFFPKQGKNSMQTVKTRRGKYVIFSIPLGCCKCFWG